MDPSNRADPSADSHRYEPLYRKVLDGEAFVLEYHFNNRDFLSRGIPVMDDQGQVVSVLVLSYDITERKRLEEALREIPKIREAFWKDVKVVGTADSLNSELERAARVADFLELGELIAYDALHRRESCGGHFREEYQTDEGEARRDDRNFTYVAAWEYTGNKKQPKLHKEPLRFEYVKPSQRSYK